MAYVKGQSHQRYIIMIEESAQEKGLSRSELLNRNSEQNAAFKKRLVDYLNENKLMDQVSYIGEPGVFDLLRIDCTAAVTTSLLLSSRTLGIEDVIPDKENITLQG